MKLGIIIYSNEPETVWNAFRFGAFAIKQGKEVKIFLTGRGVEAEGLDSEQFNITEMMKSFAETGGRIFACGTCLKLRSKDGTELCPLSNMKTMLDIIEESDKVLTF
jgi:uncharacterized protein involved in oxidation of intracellular sulfur